MLYDLNKLFTLSAKCFNSLYLSFMSQLNVGCFIMGWPTLILCSVLWCFLHWLQLWPVSLLIIASATTCVMLIWSFACSFAIFYTLCLLMFANMRLWLFLSAYLGLCLLMSPYLRLLLLTPSTASCLSEVNTVVCIYTYLLLLCASIRIWHLSVCVFIYTIMVHPIGL